MDLSTIKVIRPGETANTEANPSPAAPSAQPATPTHGPAPSTFSTLSAPHHPRSHHKEDVLDLLKRSVLLSRDMVRLFGGLMVGFMGFYVLAEYTSYTVGETQPGQLVFSNAMIQLWTAAYRLAFILLVVLVLLRLFWPAAFEFFRPDRQTGPDITNTFLHEISPTQRLWVCLSVFFFVCYLFVLLLMVKLPESVSVGP